MWRINHLHLTRKIRSVGDNYYDLYVNYLYISRYDIILCFKSYYNVLISKSIQVFVKLCIICIYSMNLEWFRAVRLNWPQVLCPVSLLRRFLKKKFIWFDDFQMIIWVKLDFQDSWKVCLKKMKNFRQKNKILNFCANFFRESWNAGTHLLLLFRKNIFFI